MRIASLALLPMPAAIRRRGDSASMRRRRSAAAYAAVGVLAAVWASAAAGFCHGPPRRAVPLAASSRQLVRCAAMSELRPGLEELAAAVGVDSTQPDKELLGEIKSSVQGVLAELAEVKSLLAEAESRAESCEIVELPGAKEKASKAEARAFAAEMKASNNPKAAPAAAAAPKPPVSLVEWNNTLTKLEEMQNKTVELTKLKEDTLARVAELETSLQAAKRRGDEASSGLREVATSLGVGGLGGIFSLMMSDKDMVQEAMMRVKLLEKRANQR